MKKLLIRFAAVAVTACVGTSCTTAYDAYGQPVQVVDPATAVVGAAAVGALAYGLANHHDHRHHYHRGHSYHRGHHHHRSYYRGHRHRHY